MDNELILSRMTVGDKRLVLVFARANMNMSKAARLAYVSRQGMRYRFDCIRNNTGFNPLDFRDLCRLVTAIEEERMMYDQRVRDRDPAAQGSAPDGEHRPG